MKIYSKKKFASGIFMVLLGGANLLTDILTDNVEIKGLILSIALFLFGFAALRRSLSEKLSREDRLEELDERNKLVELKTKSRSFQGFPSTGTQSEPRGSKLVRDETATETGESSSCLCCCFVLLFSSLMQGIFPKFFAR